MPNLTERDMRVYICFTYLKFLFQTIWYLGMKIEDCKHDSEMQYPSLRPTAILMVSLSNFWPKEEIGRAFNQAPDSLAEVASKQTRDDASGSPTSRASAEIDTLTESHDF